MSQTELLFCRAGSLHWIQLNDEGLSESRSGDGGLGESLPRGQGGDRVLQAPPPVVCDGSGSRSERAGPIGWSWSGRCFWTWPLVRNRLLSLLRPETSGSEDGRPFRTLKLRLRDEVAQARTSDGFTGWVMRTTTQASNQQVYHSTSEGESTGHCLSWPVIFTDLKTTCRMKPLLDSSWRSLPLVAARHRGRGTALDGPGRFSEQRTEGGSVLALKRVELYEIDELGRLKPRTRTRFPQVLGILLGRLTGLLPHPTHPLKGFGLQVAHDRDVARQNSISKDTSCSHK